MFEKEQKIFQIKFINKFAQSTAPSIIKITQLLDLKVQFLYLIN